MLEDWRHRSRNLNYEILKYAILQHAILKHAISRIAEARTNVRATMIVGLMLVAGPLLAQPAPARRPENEQVFQRRYQITLMENVLSSAVRHAAETMGRRMQAVVPNFVFMTGTARARGFLLQDYGFFFDVEVPGMAPSVAWTLRVMERDLDMERSLQIVREQLASLPDAQRRDVEQALRRIELAVGPFDAPGPAASPADPRARATGTVTAANVAQPAPAGRGDAPVPPAAPARDLGDEYTESVKHALIDAMLDFSGPMAIGADEWLTVAARDAYGPIAAGEIYDAMTVVLRVKGSDLAAFRADRLTREEARKRVEVREF